MREINLAAAQHRAPARPTSTRAQTGRCAFVAGALGPDESHGVAVAERERPGLPQHRLRPARGDVPGRRARADRGRRRPAPDRDDLRHAEREGRDFRGRGRRSTRRASICRSSSRARSPMPRAARCRARRPRRSGIPCGTRGRSPIGLNCALGAKQLRPYIEELSRIADIVRQRLSERRPAERLRRVRRDSRARRPS